MPSASSVAIPATDLIKPCGIGPASVTPRWSGWSVVSESSRYESIISGTFDAFTAIFTLSKSTSRKRSSSCIADATSASGVMPPCRSAIAGIERSGVHADADRQPVVLRLARDELDVLGLADVAGVQAQRLHAGFDRGERELVLEVDVGDDRHRRARARSARDRSRPLPRCTCSARCRRRPRRARRSARACRRRRRSWWSSSTAPRPVRRRRPRPCRPSPAGSPAVSAYLQARCAGRAPGSFTRSSPHFHVGRAPGQRRSEGVADRVGDVEEHRRHQDEQQHDEHRAGDRHQLGRVDPHLAAHDDRRRSARRSRSRCARRRTEQRHEVDQPEEHVDHEQQPDDRDPARGRPRARRPARSRPATGTAARCRPCSCRCRRARGSTSSCPTARRSGRAR